MFDKVCYLLRDVDDIDEVIVKFFDTEISGTRSGVLVLEVFCYEEEFFECIFVLKNFCVLRLILI